MAKERIKRALELARAEREERKGGVLPLAGRPEPVVRPLIDEVSAPEDVETVEATTIDDEVGDPHAGPQPVELTGRFLRTREVEVDPDVLRRGRLLSPGLQGVLAQSFRMLRTQVLQRLRSRGWNSLAVVSATPEEGKTTIALNLAMAISMDPMHSALLVDFDLRNPSLARRLQIDVPVGVEDVLANDAPVEPAFVRLAGYDRLMLLPAGAPVLHSSELLTGTPEVRLAGELKARYPDRIVVYDLPPLLGADDALAFLPHVDAAVLVVAEGKTRVEHVRRAIELLKDKPIVGTVLNRARGATQEYYPY